ncbi:neuronal acetylcholine receptor subunit alpha-7-like [Amphiura filiformis]|uniref:neuronal acetylcholine receptor subunit alpha-7-like n=1 Tax=Amphiura filiformis TaxID=82378 RepID=UPI003B226FD7
MDNWRGLGLMSLVLWHFVLATDASHRRGDHYNLTTELLSNYGSTIPRPVVNSSTQVEVVVRLGIYRIIDLNEYMQTLTISMYLGMVWHDEFLTWNTSKYPDTPLNLAVPASKIWRPDLHLYENVDRNFVSLKDVGVFIYPTGTVEWVTPNVLQTSCVIDARLFPFDTQRCHLRFGSWYYNLKEMNIEALHTFRSSTFFVENGIWELEDVVIQREVINYDNVGLYPEIVFTVVLKRRTGFYILTLITPCIMLSVLNLMAFILPTASGEKVSLGITNLLALVLFQQLIGNLVPPSSNYIPIISYYFAPMILISCLSIVSGVFVATLYHKDKAKPIPNCIRKLFKLQSSVDSSAEDHRFHLIALDRINSSEPTIRKANDRESSKRKNSSVYAISGGNETPLDECLDDSVKMVCEKEGLQAYHKDSNDWQKLANNIDNILLAIAFVLTIGAITVTMTLFFMHSSN